MTWIGRRGRRFLEAREDVETFYLATCAALLVNWRNQKRRWKIYGLRETIICSREGGKSRIPSMLQSNMRDGARRSTYTSIQSTQITHRATMKTELQCQTQLKS